MPVTERRLVLAGISTAVFEGGSGPPVILLHGPFANAAHWLRIIPGLSASHRVIAPDLPGHGDSRAPDDGLTAERTVAWLGELIGQTCASPPVLVGQTLGGAIAARFAVAEGPRLRRLVLVDSFGLAALELPPDFAQALSDYASQPTASTHDALWRYCAFDLDRLRARMGERWESFMGYNVHLARIPSVRSAAFALMEALAPVIAPDALERIACPVQLVWGRHDRATPLAVAEAVSARFGWPLHVIEDAADDPPVEQPEALLGVLGAAAGRSRRKSEGEMHPA
jgi:pimeloyl-ACP methyl ester carboxylesterase